MDELLDPQQPYAPTFRITNTGLLALRNIDPYCYANKFEVPDQAVVSDALTHPDNSFSTLERGETKTIICRILKTNITPTSFDMVVVVEYSIYAIPFYTDQRAFRWIGERTPSGALRLLAQPSEALMEKALPLIRSAQKIRSPQSK